MTIDGQKNQSLITKSTFPCIENLKVVGGGFVPNYGGFYGNETLKTVTISVSGAFGAAGSSAFRNAKALETITIGASSVILDNRFAVECSNLKYIDLRGCPSITFDDSCVSTTHSEGFAPINSDFYILLDSPSQIPADKFAGAGINSDNGKVFVLNGGVEITDYNNMTISTSVESTYCIWEEYGSTTHDRVDTFGKGTIYSSYVFDQNQFIVSFDANGGSVGVPSMPVIFDGVYGELPTPMWGGHNFLGWFTEPTGGEQIYTGNNFQRASDIMLYAQWDVSPEAKIGDVEYDTLISAVGSAVNGDVITLLADVELTSTLTITKDITLAGAHTVGAGKTFTDGSLVSIENAHVTIDGPTLNAMGKARVVYVTSGAYGDVNLTLQSGTITGGKTANSFIGGIYVTNKAKFVMNGGEIVGNSVSDGYLGDNYLEYTSDLWNGSEAISVINGGTIGNVFVNANAYGSESASLTVAGGNITNVFVEFDAGDSTQLRFQSGTIAKVIVAMDDADKNDDQHHILDTIDNPVFGDYSSMAALVKVGEKYYDDLVVAVAAAGADKTITLLADVHCVPGLIIENVITKGHNLTHGEPVDDAAVPPTYISEGKTAGSHCPDCCTVLAKQQSVAKITEADLIAAFNVVYAPVGTASVNGAGVKLTYSGSYTGEDVMNDLARFLGVMYNTGRLAEVTYDSVEYTWDPETGLLGSNWVDAGEKTLVSVLVSDFRTNPEMSSVQLTLAGGVTFTIDFDAKFVAVVGDLTSKGTVTYSTLEAAVAAAGADKTITLLADVHWFLI